MNKEKIKIELGPLQETLIIPLLARARETMKRSPLLIDTLAREVVERIDYDFTSLESGTVDDHQLVWVIRAYNFDTMIREFLVEEHNALIVNIGAGLDTTFQRIDNGRVFWINLDLPDVIELRQQFIADSEREISIARDVFDPAWLEEIRPFADNRCVLYLAAGVLCYFTEAQVRSLFIMLSTPFSPSNLIFDAMSRFTVWGANRSIMRKSGVSPAARLKWYLRSTTTLKKWVGSIEIANVYPMFSRLPDNTSIDKKALRDMRIADFLRMYRMVHCKLK